MTLQYYFWRKMTQCQVRGYSTCTHILVLFPFWWICQRMVLRVFLRPCSVMVLPPIPLWDRFLNAVNYPAFLIPVYPYNSLHQTTLVTVHTRNLLEKRFRLHPHKGVSLSFFFCPSQNQGQTLLFPPLVPCVLRQHLWLKRKYFTEVNASTGAFALVCFCAGWQERRRPVGSLAGRNIPGKWRVMHWATLWVLLRPPSQ